MASSRRLRGKDFSRFHQPPPFGGNVRRQLSDLLFDGGDIPEFLFRLGLFPEDGIQRPAVFPFQTPQEFQPLVDGLQAGRIERETFRIIAEREGGILDPVVEFLHLSVGELQCRIDLPDLLHGRDRAAELRQHGTAFPVEGLIGRFGKIDQLLDIRKDLLLFREGGILPCPDVRLRDLPDLKTEKILPFLPFSRQLLKPAELLLQ